MRKNLLVAALVGLCVIGLTACSRGDNKAEDTTTTAMTQEQPVEQAQPTADATQQNPAQDAAAQPVANAEQNDAQGTAPINTADNSSTNNDNTTATDAPNVSDTTGSVNAPSSK